MLEVFEIEPQVVATQSPTALPGAVIWLHGLGASNHDFEDLVPELETPHLRYVFPAAPIRPVTINGGMRMPAWYDIQSLQNPPLREREADVLQVSGELRELIEREQARGIPSSRIVLAGFSQGGAMALEVGLRYPSRLAGVLVLSGYLLRPDTFEVERHAANQETPFLFCHGALDPTVPLALGRSAVQRLQGARYDAQLLEYPMGHSVCMPEVLAIRDWLQARLPRSGT